jgi:hypothetical protein
MGGKPFGFIVQVAKDAQAKLHTCLVQVSEHGRDAPERSLVGKA